MRLNNCRSKRSRRRKKTNVDEWNVSKTSKVFTVILYHDEYCLSQWEIDTNRSHNGSLKSERNRHQACSSNAAERDLAHRGNSTMQTDTWQSRRGRYWLSRFSFLWDGIGRERNWRRMPNNSRPDVKFSSVQWAGPIRKCRTSQTIIFAHLDGSKELVSVMFETDIWQS